MKKKSLFTIFLSVSALTLTGCDSFFHLLSSNTSEEPLPSISIDGDGSSEKQKLNYTIKQYAKNSAYNISVTPSIGNPKLLVIPILLKDSNLFIDAEDKVNIKNHLETVIFGTKEETGWHSVKSYYAEESNNLCNISGSVSDWYTTNYSYTQIDSNASIKIVDAAVSDWKSKNPDLIKDYDSDKDGYLDGVIAIYGAPNYSSVDAPFNNNTNMWAYTSWTNNSANTSNPNVKNYIWASYDFMYKDTSHCTYDGHTYIHETGHLFGLDDYYDYNNSNRLSNLNKLSWSGGFSMQDYNVGSHDPYSRIVFGWADPYVPVKSCEIIIKPFSTSGDVILLTPEYIGSAYDEYFLIEYYTPTGLNEFDTRYSYSGSYPHGINQSGIRLWHVDSRVFSLNSKKETPATRYHGIESFYSDYSITNLIQSGKNYMVGPTNTKYSQNGSNNSYCSKVEELLNYRLLELIRRNDYSGMDRGKIVESSHLFKSGDRFKMNDYINSGYFANIDRSSILNTKALMNNGKSLNWEIEFSTMNSEGALIKLTKTN